MSLRLTIVVGLMLAGSHLANAQTIVARLLDETAKADLERATVVVLARVSAVHDTAVHQEPAGYRPVTVDLVVAEALKGHPTSGPICFVYAYPHGPYDGPKPVWVEPGQSGVFMLTAESSTCLRAVNDRRPIIRSYGATQSKARTVEEAIARLTLPVKAGCPPDTYEVAHEIHSVSMPLVGSRTLYGMLEPLLQSRNSRVSTCTCLAMATVWKLNEACLMTIASTTEGLREIKDANLELLRREPHWFRANPVDWTKTMVEGWGVDGMLLRLQQLTDRMKVSQSSCEILRASLDKGELAAAFTVGRIWSGDAAETSAKHEFRNWLNSGCARSRLRRQ
jgi:hypothetical protein